MQINPNEAKVDELDSQRMETLMNLFMMGLQKRGQQQHVELHNILNSILSYLEEPQYDTELQLILKKPVEFFILYNKDWFQKNELNRIDQSYTLPELDYIFFRDTSYQNKLKKDYGSRHRKSMRLNRKINLSQVIIVLGFIRQFLFQTMCFTAKKYKLTIPLIILPQVNQNSMDGVGIGKQNNQ